MEAKRSIRSYIGVGAALPLAALLALLAAVVCLSFALRGVLASDQVQEYAPFSTREAMSGSSTMEFEAGGFSVYAIVYTVDFEYYVDGKTYRFSLPGGGFVSFTELVEVLGIIGDTDSGNNGDENEPEIIDSFTSDKFPCIL